MVEQSRVVLCILDGWGEADRNDHNSIALARTPHFDNFRRRYPHGQLITSGLAVGLPEGQMGNSEVGHMTIGAGRPMMQDLPRISQSIASGEIKSIPQLASFIDACRQGTGVCHLLGLLSTGGVHSHQHHMSALASLLTDEGITVHVHAFLDGRDTAPHSAHIHVAQFMESLASCHGKARISTLSGRYYAMDRDQRWDRVEAAFRAICEGEGPVYEDPHAAIDAAYGNGKSDEFVEPCLIAGGVPMNPQDGLLMANFRADRVIQILSSLAFPNFTGFDRRGFCHTGPRRAMAHYSDALAPYYPPLFSPEIVTHSLGEMVARHGFRQLRLAETEKYAHVTYFLNGGREEPFEGEERVLIPSPRVACYDEKPEMSAVEVTDRLLEAVASKKYQLMIVNFANADMVGHTGNLAASIQAIECLDACLGRIEKALIDSGTAMLITADHGNAEDMFDPIMNTMQTAHTVNPVPIVLVNGRGVVGLRSGSLSDVAPTVLGLLSIPVPCEMAGKSLLMEV